MGGIGKDLWLSWSRTLGHMAQLDAADRRILDVLSRDGRVSMRRLAEQVHVSRANVYARVERLRSEGVVRGFRADVDPAALGLTMAAYVMLTLQQARWQEVRSRLVAIEGVVHLALTAGEADAIMLVRARDSTDLRRIVLEQIPAIDGVEASRTLLVFEEAVPR